MLVFQRTFLALAALLLLAVHITHAQYFSPRFSRSIGLGDAYTGVAEGIETTYSNDAGLAAIDYYGTAYSSGQGSYIAVYDEGSANAYDLAVVVPLDPRIGTVAISYHTLNINYRTNTYWHPSLTQIHFGRAFGEELALGASLNYHRLATNVEVRDEGNNPIRSGDQVWDAVDFGLSGLYTAKALLLPSWNDVLKAGARINNLLKPESQQRYSWLVILQEISMGASYRFSPIRGNATARVPVTLLLAAALHYDNSIMYRRYTYDAARTSLGFEIQLYELLHVRYGKENRRFLDNLIVDDPQHPVTRLGAGIVVPVGELIGAQSEYRLRLDYSHSIRKDEDAIARELLQNGFKEPWKDTFTLQLEFKP